MISFRCWYCGRRFAVVETRVGEQVTCSCKHELRIPKKSGGRCRIRRPVDWVVEGVVYGGGGALLGFGLALLIFSRIPVFRFRRGSAWLIGGLTLLGFVAGTFGGERGVNWIGRMIRDREES